MTKRTPPILLRSASARSGWCWITKASTARSTRPSAFLAVLHALAVKVFYGSYTVESSLEIEGGTPALKTMGGPGLSDTPAARACAKQHEAWAQQLPRQSGDLWE